MNDRASRAARSALAATALWLATLGAHPASHVLGVLAPAKALPASVVLANYVRALGKVERPAAVSFDYSVAQLGLRNMEQTHHVYRSGLHERDETTVVDGYALPRPAVRIIANRTYRYDVNAIAPKPSSYRFVFAGSSPHGAGFTYVFRTASFASLAFSVTEIEIDGTRFLPSVVRFKIAGGNARGSGRLAYASEGKYWIVRDAAVSAHLTSGAVAHEHITWSGYSFPSALPPSTFQAPNAHTTEDVEPPAVAPVPEGP